MPFGNSNSEARLFDLLRTARRNRPLAYAISVAVVALPTLVRLAIGQQLMPGVPFITFYPAIIFAAFVEGLGPGFFAVILSSVAAWYFFFPPFYTFAINYAEAVALVVFLLINATNIALVMILNWALERVVAREQEVRSLIETAPSGSVR